MYGKEQKQGKQWQREERGSANAIELRDASALLIWVQKTGKKGQKWDLL